MVRINLYRPIFKKHASCLRDMLLGKKKDHE